MLILPHVMDVGIEFTPIHDFAPNNTLQDAPFLGIHEWIKPDTPVDTEGAGDGEEEIAPE